MFKVLAVLAGLRKASACGWQEWPRQARPARLDWRELAREMIMAARKAVTSAARRADSAGHARRRRGGARPAGRRAWSTPTATGAARCPGILGCKLWLKFENQQFTASFKERGALNRLSALSPRRAQARRDRHVGRQPRAGRRLSRPPAVDPRHHRHAREHADGEGGEHAPARRRGDPDRRDGGGGGRLRARARARARGSPSSTPTTIRW